MSEENKIASKTVSITIPIVLEEFYNEKAEKLGISRSRCITNDLLQIFEDNLSEKKGK
jgi:hypothetical protein